MSSQAKSNYPGLFVTLEGGEGSGKSTASGLIAAILRSGKRRVTETSEPRGSSIGLVTREIILEDREQPLAPRTEALLLLAGRAQHVEEVIYPALSQGQIVLCDRFIDSTVAYQGYARGLGHEVLSDISLWASDGVMPDLTFLFDIDPQISLPRRYSAGNMNRMDREHADFHLAVREAFLSIAETNRDRFFVLDATQAPSELAKIAAQEIFRRIHLKDTVEA